MSKPSKSAPTVVLRGDGTFYSSHRQRPHPIPEDYDSLAQPPTRGAVYLAGTLRRREADRQARLAQQGPPRPRGRKRGRR